MVASTYTYICGRMNAVCCYQAFSLSKRTRLTSIQILIHFIFVSLVICHSVFIPIQITSPIAVWLRRCWFSKHLIPYFWSAVCISYCTNAERNDCEMIDFFFVWARVHYYTRIAYFNLFDAHSIDILCRQRPPSSRYAIRFRSRCVKCHIILWLFFWYFGFIRVNSFGSRAFLVAN